MIFESYKKGTLRKIRQALPSLSLEQSEAICEEYLQVNTLRSRPRRAMGLILGIVIVVAFTAVFVEITDAFFDFNSSLSAISSWSGGFLILCLFLQVSDMKNLHLYLKDKGYMSCD